ncbi:4a-hydroxytetrahydrobiopterin dehydratase [Actinoalloteichus hoggarensis]|uniref:Putative pterin-4-alpha-carbinolamine dehydratase n=1 Tax=Actinoalloteichus hoggarensis TaxID=1470176 RepID=A0A221VY65_9PSEU|nr:4a-hydroxytetrahydrobiopterin dehydratase [Actinoalloteichus hoggarensis]ASO18486.1 Putative pterin-4-alpha-carbinolamine dehydratase [Actinoalloteichus hoggarensis]MBB5921854.1 4a-hydroxytetrahydrobiopterin dehydratase [Actinoalloteichus hoggarensis]
MAEQLSDDEIDKALARLGDWRRDGDALVRRVDLPSFPEAVAVVNRVAEIAESEDHHPDIDIRFSTLVFRLSTHSAGGITRLDVTLAQEIDNVVDVARGQ